MEINIKVNKVREPGTGSTSSVSQTKRSAFLIKVCLAVFMAGVISTGCSILGGGEDEILDTSTDEAFVGTWEKENNSSVLLTFTEDKWTSSREGVTYNSGTYEVGKITDISIAAKLKVTNKGNGSANAGATGNASLSLGNYKLTISGFSDANMNGQYINPELALVSGAFDGVITGTAEKRPTNDSIYTRIVASVRMSESHNRWILGTGVYDKGNFSITLPPTPSSLLLIKIEEYLMAQDIFGSPTTAAIDENTRMCGFSELYAATPVDADGRYFQREFKNSITDENNVIEVRYVDVDRDLTIVSTNQFQKTSLLLKKGWNRVFAIRPNDHMQKRTVTTKPVEGTKWTF